MVHIYSFATARFNHPLTTWPRSLSMLCQRASLCPAETREDKHQQATKRSPGGRSYLDHIQSSRKCLTQLTIHALDGEPVTTPLLAPQTSKVHDPVTRHSPQAQHRGSVYSCQIYSVLFSIGSFFFWSLLPYTLNMRMHRTSEINGELTRHLFESSRERRGWGHQEEKLFYSKSYPFHSFQITLQQRVQSEDHIVAEALELEEERDLQCSCCHDENTADIMQCKGRAI